MDGMRRTATDVYALGCIGAELLNGKLAFPGPDFARQHFQRLPTVENASPKLHGLLHRMMAKEVESRPTVDIVLQELEAIRTPRIPGGSGATRFRDAVTRHQDDVAREAARRLDDQTRSQYRANLSHAALAELVGVGERLVEAIEGFAPGARRHLNGPQGATIALPQVPRPAPQGQRRATPTIPTLEKLTNLQFHAQYGHGSIALTNGMFSTVAERLFEAANWNVYAGDVIAVWHRTYARCASLWYASMAGEKPCWFEVGYYSHIPNHYPTALRPGKEAADALARSGGSWQLAYTPRKFDNSHIEDFVDRWLGWFGNAVDGSLAVPEQMPEN